MTSRPPLTVMSHSLLRSILAVPLWVKLCGANALIVAAAILLVRIASRHGGEISLLEEYFLGALAVTTAVNVALVALALRPLRALEHTAKEVWRGNTDARVPFSLLADRDMARVGHTLNLLVDSFIEDRARSRQLTALVISQAEAEQAQVAHELHESAAQRLAAHVMQISVIARDMHDTHTRAQLEEVRDTVAATLEQLRRLARDMSARTYNDSLLSRDVLEEADPNRAVAETLAARR
jgi:signal transduction histidine kinase